MVQEKRMFLRKIVAISIPFLLVLGLVMPSISNDFFYASAIDTDEYTVQQLDYTDSLNTLNNPERGFYVPSFMVLKESGNTVLNPSEQLVHLRIDISAFSSNAQLTTDTYGVSQDFTEDALSALSKTLENIKKAGHTVIVRSCYDHYFDGHSNCEPDQEQILRHIKQLAAVYTEYKDVIAYIELGTYGPWGEMHTSKCCNKTNVTEALNTMLSNTPKELAVGVRTPGYVAGWLGINESDFYIGSSAYETAMTAKGQDATRVGMFNDGYLGSDSDLGTYGTITRAKGVEWLGEMAKTTMYGGEVVADGYGKIVPGVIGDYNTISYIATEAFQTHTSYLNIQWNYNVINAWKEQIYEKAGDEYNGQTAFKYVNDHLGYRLILRKSELPKRVEDRKLNMRLTIDNVGFGNIVKNKVATIVLKDANDQYFELPFSECDPTTLWSNQANVVVGSISLPETLADGTYSVYLRFSQYGDYASDNNYNCVQFANASDYWDSTIGSNYIGTFENHYVEPAHDSNADEENVNQNRQNKNLATGSGDALIGSEVANSDINKKVKKGQTYTVSSMKYKVTRVATAKKSGTVMLTGSTKKATKLKGTVAVKNTVRVAGKVYHVTAVKENAFKGYKKIKKVSLGKYITTIGKNAFRGCKSITSITIKSAKVKRIGNNAIKGIYKKAVIKVPAKKVSSYKKLLKKKTGFRKTMKCKR